MEWNRDSLLKQEAIGIIFNCDISTTHPFPSLACVQTPPPFISGVVVIQTLLGTVASDVFKLTFWNAGALQFLDNRFSGVVVGKLLVWAGNFQG